MIELTPVNLRSVAVVAARCGDIATGVGATLIGKQFYRCAPTLFDEDAVTEGRFQ